MKEWHSALALQLVISRKIEYIVIVERRNEPAWWAATPIIISIIMSIVLAIISIICIIISIRIIDIITIICIIICIS